MRLQAKKKQKKKNQKNKKESKQLNYKVIVHLGDGGKKGKF